MDKAKPPNSPRPICVHCGKPHGRRDVKMTPVVWPGDQSMPDYDGPGVAVKLRPGHGMAHGHGSALGVPFKEGDRIAYRDIWDGVTWFTPYAPFCTLRCALDYARQAYKREQRR